MSNCRIHMFLSGLFLLLGGGWYVLFRADSYIAALFACIPVIRRLQAALYLSPFVAWGFYLPDFLWALSLCLALLALHHPQNGGVFVCAGGAVLCGCCWELLQVCGAVGGTGDWIDVLMYCLASLLSILIHEKARKKT